MSRIGVSHAICDKCWGLSSLNREGRCLEQLSNRTQDYSFYRKGDYYFMYFMVLYLELRFRWIASAYEVGGRGSLP